MMLGMLVIGAILLYLILEPAHNKNENLWLAGINGATLSIVGAYNLLIIKGILKPSALLANCASGGGIWASLFGIAGISLLLVTVIAWIKSRKENKASHLPSEHEPLM